MLRSLTCFLFARYDDSDGILSVCLDLQGVVVHPVEVRSIEDIRALQVHARTIMVLPTEWCGIYQVELPQLSDQKAREAIPYALEDNVAQSAAQIHIAFDKSHYQDGRYLVVVTAKSILMDWMERLRDLNVDYDLITVDWFALQPGEAWVDEQAVVMNVPMFQGAVSLDIWDNYDRVGDERIDWQIFSGSPKRQEWANESKNKQNRYEWIAQRLDKTKPINLCQGALQHTTSQTQITRWYQWAGMLVGAWMMSFICIHLGMYFQISHQAKNLDQQIAKIYRVFFPEAQQVISPKIRIMQLLKEGQMGNNANFWSLIENVSVAFTQGASTAAPSAAKIVAEIQGWQFQNQILTVTCRCDNFVVLEKIEAFLQNKHVHVHQLSAATENEKVVAKLELSL